MPENPTGAASVCKSSTDTAKKFNRYGKKVQPIRQKSSTDTAKKFNRYGKKVQPIQAVEMSPGELGGLG